MMKKINLIFLAVAFILLLTVFASSDDSSASDGKIVYEDSTYMIISEDKAELRLDHVDSPGAVTIPETIRYEGKEYTVTTVHSDALLDATEMTSITFPRTISALFGNLFSNCCMLSEIYVDPDNPNYRSNEGILTSKDGWKLIRYPCARQGTQFTADSSIDCISNSAFCNCVNLESVILSNKVTSIGSSAFYGCTSLKYIEIPKTVVSIGTDAFNSCSSLERIDIHSKNTNLKEGTFSSCISLKQIVLPKSITIIDDKAFSNCISLENITLNENVSSISENAFDNCCSLKNINVPDGNKNYYSSDGVLFTKNEDTLIKYPALKNGSSYTIPTGVKTLGYRSFEYACNLVSVVIPDSVNIIGDHSFLNCTSLTGVSIPSNVSKIGTCAFYGCSSIENFSVSSYNGNYSSADGVLFDKNMTVLISYPDSRKETGYDVPKTVIEISVSAFCRPVHLTYITIPGSTAVIPEDSFKDCSSLQNIIVSDKNDTFSSIDGILFNKSGSILMKYPNGRTDDEYCVPAKVYDVGTFAFYNCTFLKTIDVDGSNPKYISIDGCLYDKSRMKLCACPAGLEEYVSPSNIKGINSYSFSGKIKIITLSDSIVRLDRYSIVDCMFLEKINNLNKETVVPAGAIVFNDCRMHTISIDSDQIVRINISSIPWNVILEYSYEKGNSDNDLNSVTPIIITVLSVTAIVLILIFAKRKT